MPWNIFDGLVNFVSGLGTFKDPTTAAQYQLNLLNRDQLETMYRTDWLSKRIVDGIPEDATREWRAWKGSNPQIEAIEELEKTHQIQMKTQLAMLRGRLYGGASLVIGVADGKESWEPLNLDGVKKDSLKFVVVMNRYELMAGPRDYNVSSPWYTRPSYYTVATPLFGFNGETGAIAPGVYPGPTGYPVNTQDPGQGFDGQLKIHPSRVIEFVGNALPDWRLIPMGGGWGDPVLQTCEEALKDYGITVGGVANLINDAKVDIIHIDALAQKLSTAEKSRRLLGRFGMTNQTKSMINALLLDKDEVWERKQTAFSTLDAIILQFMMIVAAAGGYPPSRLFGQGASKSGLGNGGGDDLRNFYDDVAQKQKNVYTPALHPLDMVLLRSALGKYDPSVTYEWNPLWQTEPAVEADIAVKKATVANLDVTMGLINGEALRRARINQLIEDGTYPGLEDAIDELGEEPDVTVSRLWSPGVDPITGKPIQAMAPKLPGQQNPLLAGTPGGPPKQPKPPQPGGGGNQPGGNQPGGNQPGGGSKPAATINIKHTVTGDAWNSALWDEWREEDHPRGIHGMFATAGVAKATSITKNIRGLLNNPHTRKEMYNSMAATASLHTGGVTHALVINTIADHLTDLVLKSALPAISIAIGASEHSVAAALTTAAAGYAIEQIAKKFGIHREKVRDLIEGGIHHLINHAKAIGAAYAETLHDSDTWPGEELMIEALKLFLHVLQTTPVEELCKQAKNFRVTDSTPRTLFVRRQVLNPRAIRAWAKGQGFETVVEDDEMHVTLIHSRSPVDWISMGEAYGNVTTGNADEWGWVKVPDGGPRSIETFTGGAVVLCFASDTLKYRHDHMVQMGAASDYEPYQPHLTLTYHPGVLDLRKVSAYQGPITLGPEIFSEIKEHTVAEDAQGFINAGHNVRETVLGVSGQEHKSLWRPSEAYGDFSDPGKGTKVQANYKDHSPTHQCRVCRFFESGKCEKVAGPINYLGTCDWWKPAV